MSKLVNGPINCVRLKGKIGNIDKVIYLYLDWHLSVEYQTRCEDIRATDMKKHLTEEFDKLTGTDRIVDFFYEIPPTVLVRKQHNYKQKYIWEVSSLFRKIFNYDPKKRKVLQNKEFPNVRFHYFDIRDLLAWKTDKILGDIINFIYANIWHNSNITSSNLNTIKDSILIFSSNVTKIYDFIFGDRKIKKINKPPIPPNAEILSKYTEDDKLTIGLNYLKKILEDFSHKDNKDKFNNYVNNELSVAFKKLFSSTSKIMQYLTEISNNISKIKPRGHYCVNNKIFIGNGYKKNIDIAAKLTSMIHEIDELHTSCFSYIIDLVSLRRFVDKDYIKNCVVYSGAYHSTHHIYFLIKYFNFEITHYSHGPYDKKIIKDIKKSKIITDTKILCQFHEEDMIQCTDMSKFPENYS